MKVRWLPFIPCSARTSGVFLFFEYVEGTNTAYGRVSSVSVKRYVRSWTRSSTGSMLAKPRPGTAPGAAAGPAPGPARPGSRSWECARLTSRDEATERPIFARVFQLTFIPGLLIKFFLLIRDPPELNRPRLLRLALLVFHKQITDRRCKPSFATGPGSVKSTYAR